MVTLKLELKGEIVLNERMTPDKRGFMICVIAEALTNNCIYYTIHDEDEDTVTISDYNWVNDSIARLDVSREEYKREYKRIDDLIKEK